MSGLDCAPLLISAAVPFCPPSHRGLRPTRMPDLRPRLVVTNLHLALATAKRFGCTAAEIGLITGSLFIELFSALCC